MEIYDFEKQSSGPDDSFCSADVRQSHGEVDNSNWDKLVVAAMSIAENIDPYKSDLPDNTVIRAVDALDWKARGGVT